MNCEWQYQRQQSLYKNNLDCVHKVIINVGRCIVVMSNSIWHYLPHFRFFFLFWQVRCVIWNPDSQERLHNFSKRSLTWFGINYNTRGSGNSIVSRYIIQCLELCTVFFSLQQEKKIRVACLDAFPLPAVQVHEKGNRVWVIVQRIHGKAITAVRATEMGHLAVSKKQNFPRCALINSVRSSSDPPQSYPVKTGA